MGQSKINIICVGKIKETYMRDLISGYVNEISRKYDIDIIELQDEKTPENASEKEEELIKNVEGDKILSRLDMDSFIIPLCIEGKAISTEKFQDNWKVWTKNKSQPITFIIGGSLGLSSKVVSKGDYKLSFGKMTFPHQMMRVLLLEQLSLL